jgi:hypothetical protein
LDGRLEAEQGLFKQAACLFFVWFVCLLRALPNSQKGSHAARTFPKVEETPAMEELIGWLGERMLPQTRATIVHGDFRLENLMFHPTAPRG